MKNACNWIDGDLSRLGALESAACHTAAPKAYQGVRDLADYTNNDFCF